MKNTTFLEFCEFPQDVQEELWNNMQEHIDLLNKQITILKRLDNLSRIEIADLKADIQEIKYSIQG